MEKGEGLELEYELELEHTSPQTSFLEDEELLMAEVDLDDIHNNVSLSDTLARTRAATVPNSQSRRERATPSPDVEACGTILKRPRNLCVKYVVPCLPGSLLLSATS